MNTILLFPIRSVWLLALVLLFGRPVLLHAEPALQPTASLPSGSFLLVASRQMADPRFRKSVIVVTRHGNTGPLGVIINRPRDVTLDQVFPDHPLAEKLKLFYGGPAYPKQISYLVRGTGFVEGALKVTDNTILAYDPALLDDLISGKRAHTGLRVMHGLATWANGQLESEIKLGDWFVLPFDETVVFDRPPEDLWQELQGHAAAL